MFCAAVMSSGVCSNGGGCDLATAIDLSDKDNTRVTHGCVRRVLSDVGAPGGGDVAGLGPELGRIAVVENGVF
ncbi:hypothetical protein HID58_095604, partial [Brassica napus]